nr:MAG TPA: hypothetical protein [Caudoviricetes sp.]
MSRLFAWRKGMAIMSSPKIAPSGFRWVFCRFRRVRNSTRVLDAHDYGYEAWAFLVRAA